MQLEKGLETMPHSCREVTVGELTPLGQSERPGEFFRLRLSHPGWADFRPGQFVMVRPAAWDLELLWARPFSIAALDESGLSIFFQVVGRGTARLAQVEPGDTVVVWGPLGNGFAVEPGTPTLCLAGGVGIAPFEGYAARHPDPANLELFFAHRLPLACYSYADLSGKIRSECRHEAQPSDLAGIIERIGQKIEDYKDGLVLACGPTPFLRTVRQAALACGTRAQVSLENRMACGVGACLGCVAKNAEGRNVQACTCGPVFWVQDVRL